MVLFTLFLLRGNDLHGSTKSEAGVIPCKDNVLTISSRPATVDSARFTDQILHHIILATECWRGWAKAGARDVIAMCIFPDLSSIDSWGLTYHSDGTIRGADLTNLLRYKPPQAPQVFP